MSIAAETLQTVEAVTQSGYKWGFETDIEMEFAPKGVNADIVRLISERKGEPAWLLQWRLNALTACVDGGECDTHRLCPVHGRWDPVNDAIRAALAGITLADMEAAMVPPAFRAPTASTAALVPSL